jgi:hypothetical protein
MVSGNVQGFSLGGRSRASVTKNSHSISGSSNSAAVKRAGDVQAKRRKVLP